METMAYRQLTGTERLDFALTILTTSDILRRSKIFSALILLVQK